MRGHRPFAALSALVLALTLGACAEESGRADSPDASTQEPGAEQFPAMQEETPEGAMDAHSSFVALVFHARSSGDTAALEEMSAAQCTGCAELVAEIEDLAQEDRLWTPATVTPSDGGTPSEDGDLLIVDRTFVIGAHTEIIGPERASREVPEAEHTATSSLVWEDERWKVVSIQLEQS